MRLPGWFRIVFTAVMLTVCCITIWSCLTGISLAADQAQLMTKLDMSRGRERRQQAQYTAAVDKLPLVLAQLDEILPLADDAHTRETDLRAERKRLRAEAAALQSALTDLQAVNETLSPIVWDTQTLWQLINPMQ